MRTRETSHNEHQAAAEASDDRVYWARWEENHYPQETTRRDVITERCEEAGYQQ